MRRKRLLIGVLFVILFLAVSAGAGEHELQFEVLDSQRQSVPVLGQNLRTSTEPGENLLAEPKYRSRMPLYAVAILGEKSDNKYTLVLDESKGTGRGYDTLYVDRNNNEDLTDDPRAAGRIQQSGSSTSGNFNLAAVMIDYSDRTVPYYFTVTYSRYGTTRIRQGDSSAQNMSLKLMAKGCYTGMVSFGESPCRIALIDYNANGLFNEYFKLQSDKKPSCGHLHPTGDQILIDANSNGRFEQGSVNNDELYPCAKYLQIDGKWHHLDIAAHGAQVNVRVSDIETGTLDLPEEVGDCSLQLLSRNGIVKIAKTGEKVRVPVGTYQVYTKTAKADDASGSWQYSVAGAWSGTKYEVTEGNTLPLHATTPIRVNIAYSRSGVPASQPQAQPKSGDTIQLSLTLSGQAGEALSSVQKNGQNPPAPTFKVVDDSGKTVANGAFEYG